MEPDRLLTIRQVAELLSASVRTIENWLVRGLIPKPIRIANARRWQLQTIQDFIIKLGSKNA